MAMEFKNSFMSSEVNDKLTTESSWNSTPSKNESEVHLTCDDIATTRILSLVFSFVATMFLLYLILALTVYVFKKKLLQSRGPKCTPAKRSTLILTTLIVFGALFDFVYVGVEIPLLSPKNDRFCDLHQRMKIVVFGLSAICVYGALWFRIYTVFYKEAKTKKNTSKLLKYINFSAMPLLFLLVIANLVSLLITPPYISVGCGCTQLQSEEENLFNWALVAGCSVLLQLILLFSFSYPLYLHRKKMLSRGFDHKSVIPIVKRAAIVAAICILTDLLSFLFATLYHGPTLHLHHTVYGCDLLVNLAGTIFVFADWREKLFPFGMLNADTSPGVNHIAFRPAPTANTAANAV